MLSQQGKPRKYQLEQPSGTLIRTDWWSGGCWEDGSDGKCADCICRFVADPGVWCRAPISGGSQLPITPALGSSVLLRSLKVPEQTWHTFTEIHMHLHNAKINFLKMIRIDSMTDKWGTEKYRM